MVKVTRRTVGVRRRAAGRDRLGRADRGRRDDARPKPRAAVEIDYSAPTDWMQLSPEEMAGIALFPPGELHQLPRHGRPAAAKSGPDLTHGHHPQGRGVDDPAFQASRGDAARHVDAGDPTERCAVESLAAFLLKLNPNNATALDNAPEFATAGALVYQANHCGACHLVNGVGMKVGPPLNGIVGAKRAAGWKTISPIPKSSRPGRSCRLTSSRRRTWKI